ncbi:hypothetical protein [Pricia sp.]|uniref:hypothetical protein n=1 Tax=Pricia sp. TaxID=2268138 RepID=UPI00359325B3
MRTIKSTIIAMCIASILHAQEAERSFVPNFVKDGKVENFERVVGKMEAKAIGFGYGGANRYLTVFEGPESAIRFNAGNLPQFIFAYPQGGEANNVQTNSGDFKIYCFGVV